MPKNKYQTIENFIKITSLCSAAIAANDCSGEVGAEKVCGFVLGLISVYTYGAAEHLSNLLGDYINQESQA